MRSYERYKYIFPPRPNTKAPQECLKIFDNKSFFAQPKLNGSCAVLFLKEDFAQMMTRHASSFAQEIISKEKLQELHRGNGWMVLCGEYLNKSKKDKNNKIFNAKFVIFDILVYENRHLIGTTVSYRQELLAKLFKSSYHDGWIKKIDDTNFIVENIEYDFEKRWQEIVKIDLYEGFVLKKKNGILEQGTVSANNIRWQLKIRKSTKCYSF